MECWEHKKCVGKEDCPAYPDHGDCCMVKTGTVCCEGSDLIDKIISCKECDFYNSEHFNTERANRLIDEEY